jgi:hypothetical protein
MAKDCVKPKQFKDRKLLNAEGWEMIFINKSCPLVSSS